ncbi:MAG: hypothetical protein A3F67_10105 [Verrucomicrobia bacterium RIFCSPHIGHO2_12_FULL_41_10]|nr:MAG: hypothetical protein A3F67_10105 [Verrucomicrobia bacterium RIFCSPHIGHO2_12_FULL_41_10]
MKVFLSLFLGALISFTSFNSTIAQSVKIETSNSDNNKNRHRQESLSTEEHQVTVQEYCDFLNAVATTEDPHHLYDERMESDPEEACIIRSGIPGNYSYLVVEGKANLSISQVNLFNQARYCNWLENGQLIVSPDFQTRESTEDGVYTLSGEKILGVNSGANHLLRNGLKDNSEKSFNIDPQLMMEPAVIEEAGKALQRGLGFSEKNTSPAQINSGFSNSRIAESSQFTENFMDFTNPNVFTIIQNHTDTSNAFSSSPQHIDPALKDQAQRAIGKVIKNSSTQLHDYYKKADEAWVERDSGWKEHGCLYHELQKNQKQLTLSEQKLEQAKKATTSEELQKTRLGKIAKYAGLAGGMLGKAPDPHAQVMSAGVSVVGGFASAINLAWSYGDLAFTKREYQQISEQHKLAAEKETQMREQLRQLERRAEEIETLASTQAEQSTKKLAEQLYPQTDWKESQCQAWGVLVGSTESEKEKLQLSSLVHLHPNWVKEATRNSWEQKIETGKEQLLALQKRANLPSLKSRYENALQQHQRAQVKEGQQRILLDQAQNSIEELKQDIEKRVDELERLETRDKIQFEQKKKEFIKKLEELEKTQLRLQELQKKWEKAVQRTSDQEEQRYIASITYDNAIKEARALTRVKKACQTDRELWQRIWLKSASSNYKDWSLPEISASQTTENLLTSLEETIKIEKCEPPIQRLEELEVQGRDLRIREAMMNIATKEKPTAFTTILHPFSKQPSLSNQTSFYYSAPSNLDQVKEWVQYKQERPSAQDQERWEVREKLDQLQKEIRVQRKELKKEDPSQEGKMRADSDEMDDGNDDNDDSKSQISVSQRSVSSIGGRFFNRNKKQSASPLPSISEEQQFSPKQEKKSNLNQEKLRQRQEQASELIKRYFQLLTQAENERLSALGQKGAIPFNKETDRNYAWEKADRKSVAMIQEKRREKESEEIEQEQQKSWQTNTERWRARAQADRASEDLSQVQQKVLKLGSEEIKAKTAAQQAEVVLRKSEALAEEEQLKQAYVAAENEWKKIAQEYYDEPSKQSMLQEEDEVQAYELLKERDRVINKRWEKLLKSYNNPGLEKSDIDQEVINAIEEDEISEFKMNLGSELNKMYGASLKIHPKHEALALANYREQAFQRALEHARNYPEEMAEVWEQIESAENNVPAAQLEINKEAAKIFKKEVRQLEKIENTWKRILDGEQEEAKQTREQAAQEYYRGNLDDWRALSEQERTRYNNEAKKANEEYTQKRDEAQETIVGAQAEKLKIEAEIKRIEGKSWVSITAARRKEKLTGYYRQLEEVESTIKKTSEQLNEQEEFLKIGKKAKQKESYYHTLTQVQWAQEKARDASSSNPYWKQAAECYGKANTQWKEASDDKNLEPEQKQHEKNAASYQSAAESYEKAAQENAELLKTHNKGKETLISLYNQQAKLYEQLAQQQEKDRLSTKTADVYDTSDTSDLQEDIQQLEKKIERYLGTRGAQIEDLQENLPLLKKRLEGLQNEVVTLRQQGKEGLALKKEGLATSLRELITSCQKSLEDLLQESPESSERAANALTAIQSQKTKDQQLQQTIEQILQLEAKMTPLEQRAALLPSEITAAQGRGELFLVKGQQNLMARFNQVLEQTKKINSQLLTQPEGTVNTTADFQTCMSQLEQLGEQNHYLQQITPQLQQLDQTKKVLMARGMSLKESIKLAQSQGETFLTQGQEQLYVEAKKLYSEIDPTAGPLLAKAEKAPERTNDLLFRCKRFEEQEKTLQENAIFLRELGQYKNSFQKRVEVLSREITASQSRGETLLVEGQQELHKTIGQAVIAIDRASKQILESGNNSPNNTSEQTAALIGKLKQLKERDEALQQNAPTLLILEQKKNYFQDRLKNLTAEIAAPKNNGAKTYLSEAQQFLAGVLNQALLKIDQSAKQLIANANEASTAAKTLLTQLDQLEQRDQNLQKNAPDLGKLNDKKNLLQHRLESLTLELKASQEQQQHLIVEKQRTLINEITQALAKIDQSAKQLLSNTSGIVDQTQTLIGQVELLEQRDQRLLQQVEQLKNLKLVFTPLQNRAKALENEIITSQIRGEITLAQAQKNLLEEIKNILEQTSQAVKQLLTGDESTSEAASLSIKELTPRLEELRRRDERIQENGLLLRDLEQKRKLLQERIETLKGEIASSEKIGEALFAQQQQNLLSTLQQTLDKASEIGTQLTQGTDNAAQRVKALFQEMDQLQQRNQQLKENVIKVQEFQQKKTLLQNRLATLSEEIKTSQSQGELLIAQGQETLIGKMRGMLSRIEKTMEQLRSGTVGIISAAPTSETVNTLLAEIGQLEQQDYYFKQNIPLLRECLERGRFLHNYITTLQEKITAVRASQFSQDRGEQFLAQGQQKLLDSYQQTLKGIEEVVKQLLSGTKEASEQAKALLTQIKQLQQREEALQKNIPILLELDQKRAILQTRAETVERDIIDSKNRGEMSFIQWDQQNLLEAIQGTRDHVSELMKQLIDGVNYTYELAEAQRKVQAEDSAKIAAAEKILQEKQEIKRKRSEAVTIAQELYSKAHQAGSIARDAGAKAEGALVNDQELLWGEAIERIKEAGRVCVQAADFHRIESAQAEESQRGWWSEQLSTIEKWRTWCAAKLTEWETRKNQVREVERFAQEKIAKETAIRVQIEELKQSSLKTKTMKEASSNSSEQWELKQSIDRFADAIEYLNNAIRVIVSGVSENTAWKLWKEAATLSREAAEKYIASAQMLNKGTKEDASRLDSEADISFVKSLRVRYLAESNEAEAGGNRELAEKWNAIARINQQAIDPLTQAVRAKGEGNKNEGDGWQLAGQGFYYGAEKLEKALEAKIIGKLEVARKWKEAAEQQVRSVEYFTQAARAHKEGKKDEGESWYNAGRGFYWTADKLEKAIGAEVAGNSAIARKWREAAEQQTRSVEPYTQGARAKAAGKKDEGESWHNAGRGFYWTADKLEKAIEAEVAGKSEVARKYREAAEQQVRSVEYYTRAARAHKEGKADEGHRWNRAGNGFYSSANTLEKAIKAEVVGNSEAARKWREVAEQHIRSVEPYTQGARAKAAGKIDEGESWHWAGQGFINAAEKLEEAIEAENSDRREEARECREAVEQYKRSVDHFTQAARSYATGNTGEGSRCHRAGLELLVKHGL